MERRKIFVFINILNSIKHVVKLVNFPTYIYNFLRHLAIESNNSDVLTIAMCWCLVPTITVVLLNLLIRIVSDTELSNEYS